MSQNKVKLTLKLVRISGRMPFIPALNIRSNLQGAKILLDGVDTGRVTNARFVRWKAGTYSVEKEGYQFSPETSVEEIAPYIEKTIDFIGIDFIGIENVWTIDPATNGTKYINIRCATTGQTLTVSGGADIRLVYTGYDSGWVKSVDIPSGASTRSIYFRGNGVGGNLLIPSPQNVTYLLLVGTGTSIMGSINGMALTSLSLSGTDTSITGSINGMALTYLHLTATGSSIIGTITGMELTYLYLSNTGTAITGTPAQIGTPLSSIRIVGGTSYNYPWTSQSFGGTKRTWTATTMSINCVAAAPTPAQFNTWLGGTPGIKGLADVSNATTATLTLKNTPTADAMIAARVGPDDVGSGMYRMLALGYSLVLGTSAPTVTETPVISRNSAGVYSIACATAGASIYYTLDGSTPDATKTLYATPLDIIFPQTLKAIAIKDAVSSGVATLVITESVWTINPAADGTKYIRIQCATTGQTLTVAGGAEIKLTSGGTWGTSVDIPSGATNRDVYFRGNGTGGKLLIPSPQNVTSLKLESTGTSITGSINGMALTYLNLIGTGTAITGSITGMPLTRLTLGNRSTSITGTPAQIGTPLAFISIFYGTSYDYPWTSQTFGGAKITWTASSMSIDCAADAPTPEQFNTWLGGTPGTNGLADVSKEVTPGTVMLTLKNTPTEAAMAAKGVGPTDVGSGIYRMLALGYTLTLGE